MDEHISHSERAVLDRYGLEVRTRMLSLADPPVRVRALVQGEGPAVFLLHGGGGTPALFAPLMARLPGVTVFAVDRPGCGVSDPFDYQDVDVRTHAVSFITSVLDVLELDNPVFVANSLGGLWSFWFALDRPERMSAMVQLGCPAMLFGSRIPPLRRFPSVDRSDHSPERPELAIKMLQRDAGRAALERMPSEMVRSMYEAEVRTAHLLTRQSLLEGMINRLAVQPDLGIGDTELQRIRQPVVFLWGTEDRYGGPDLGLRPEGLLPNGRLELLPGAGHLPWIEEPERCARTVLDLVQSLAPTA